MIAEFRSKRKEIMGLLRKRMMSLPFSQGRCFRITTGREVVITLSGRMSMLRIISLKDLMRQRLTSREVS